MKVFVTYLATVIASAVCLVFIKGAGIVGVWAYYLVSGLALVACVLCMKYGNELCSQGLLKQRPDIRSLGRALLVLSVAFVFLGYAIALTLGLPGFQP